MVHFHVDWTYLAATGFAGGVISLIRFGVFLTLRAPANVAFRKQWFVRNASRLLPKHADLSGQWKIEWRVQSEHFPKSNIHTATLSKFFHVLSAQIESTTVGGSVRRYGFIGKLDGSTITGEWFDLVAGKQGYYGAYQLTLSREMASAQGKWLGVSSSGEVKADELIWTKCGHN